MTEKYDIVLQQSESTVVNEFIPQEIDLSKDYESEAKLEASFIKQLISLGYEESKIHTHPELLANLRAKIELLNKYHFTDKEWKRLCDDYLIKVPDGIEEKTQKIQEDNRYTLTLDNGEKMNVSIIDKKNIFNNSVQVIHQYETSSGTHANRYDVTILVNGLPLVHIELKRRGVNIKEAFNQIKRYNKESFWADTGLFEYTQIYVISNGTYTKYYSNTTRNAAIKENNGTNITKKKTSNSFEFTSYWADAKNKNILDLVDFTSEFFKKNTLLNILTKYCVFTSDKLLLVMRPYQIAATERILNRIEIAHNHHLQGTIDAGGYVWHTTGSGKTLTSFKTAQLATALPYIDKVLFVVDRKDLDYQTMKEYDKFQKGAANSNTSTAILQKQLESNAESSKIIITTIQKLSTFVKGNKMHPVYSKNVVIIFDECHRSQFGDMHRAITHSFKKYFIFGFTGTPIFAGNATMSTKNVDLKTTEQTFGKNIHTYTIVNAIHDKNVLPFRIDYVNTVKPAEEISGGDVSDIDREAALLAPARIEKIVEYVLEHFAQKTKRNEKAYTMAVLDSEMIAKIAKAKDQKEAREFEKHKLLKHMQGFNSIFACASIEAAKRYYAEFQKQQKDLPEDKKLKIALIYSWAPNADEDEFASDGLGEENNEDTTGLDKDSRDFLEAAIVDYNKYFDTAYDTSADKFSNYYKDLSLRVKNREVDLLIVVNMFLTGFDATTLNTLWVDKKLKEHGLIQAFSRTNRILNSVKSFGNIVCFRNLEDKVNEAIARFGDPEAGGIVVLKTYNEYYFGYEGFAGYKQFVEDLKEQYPIGTEIYSEKAKKAFVKLYNQILKVRNILSCFDDFKGNEILTEYEFQNYQSMYLTIWDEYKSGKTGEGPESIEEDIVFEIELVKSVEVNIDYILMLVEKYHGEHLTNKEINDKVSGLIDSSPTLRNKKELILDFISKINVDTSLQDEWTEYVEKKKNEELTKIIADENLKDKETRDFIEAAFEKGEIDDKGTAFAKILPPTSMFGGGLESRVEKKKRVLEKLIEFFERFFNL